MRRPRPVAIQSTAALIVAILAIVGTQFFRNAFDRNPGGEPPPIPTAQPADTARPSAAPAITRPDVGFRSRGALDDHFRKHGREFGPATTRDEYLRRAQTLRDAPAGGPVLELKRPDGVITRFDRRTGDFGAYNPDATIRTFFRPNDGEQYFHRQAQRDPD